MTPSAGKSTGREYEPLVDADGQDRNVHLRGCDAGVCYPGIVEDVFAGRTVPHYRHSVSVRVTLRLHNTGIHRVYVVLVDLLRLTVDVHFCTSTVIRFTR